MATSASARGCRSRSIGTGIAVADLHVDEQRAEVGLVDAELLLHRRRGEADLAAAHAAAAVEVELRVDELHGIAGVHVVGRADDVTDRRARHARLAGQPQVGGGLLDQGPVDHRPHIPRTATGAKLP